MSILRIGAYNEECKDEEDEIITLKVMQKLQAAAEQEKEDIITTLHTVIAFNPTILCLLAIRPTWQIDHPSSCPLLAIFAAIVSCSQLAIAWYLYDSEDYNLLARGPEAPRNDLLRNISMAIFVVVLFPVILKLQRDLLLQVYVLDPLPYNFHILPLLAALALIADWLAVLGTLLAGLVVIAEADTSQYLQSLAVMIVLASCRIYLSHGAVHLTGLLLGDGDFAETAFRFLAQQFKLTNQERQRALDSAKVRHYHALGLTGVLVLGLGYVMYELDCPGDFGNCILPLP